MLPPFMLRFITLFCLMPRCAAAFRHAADCRRDLDIRRYAITPPFYYAALRRLRDAIALLFIDFRHCRRARHATPYAAACA